MFIFLLCSDVLYILYFKAWKRISIAKIIQQFLLFTNTFNHFHQLPQKKFVKLSESLDYSQAFINAYTTTCLCLRAAHASNKTYHSNPQKCLHKACEYLSQEINVHRYLLVDTNLNIRVSLITYLPEGDYQILCRLHPPNAKNCQNSKILLGVERVQINNF